MKIKFYKILCLAVVLLGMCGCSGEGSKDRDTQQPAMLDIYDASDGALLNTVDDDEIISEFNDLFGTVSDDYREELQGRLADQVDESEAVCRIVAYKEPASVINDGSLEAIYAVTVYADSRVVKMQVSPDSVKNVPLADELLIWYEELSDEGIAFLTSLAE